MLLPPWVLGWLPSLVPEAGVASREWNGRSLAVISRQILECRVCFGSPSAHNGATRSENSYSGDVRGAPQTRDGTDRELSVRADSPAIWKIQIE